MKNKLASSDLIMIAAVTVVSFPVMFFAVMLMTGNMRIHFGPRDQTPQERKELALVAQTRRRDSLAVEQSKTFAALEHGRREIEAERDRLRQQKEHVTMLEKELETTKEELAEVKKQLEQSVVQGNQIEKDKIRQLAKVYGSMGAEEAARILETLDDALVGKILTALNDDRQKAKILSTLSKDKASRISRRIGEGR
jgi:flagellar motility protein MotE (MotC chaperone)